MLDSLSFFGGSRPVPNNSFRNEFARIFVQKSVDKFLRDERKRDSIGT